MKIPARVLTLAAVVGSSFALAVPTFATVFTFNTDPFAGTTALTTPGRQIVGTEDFVTFDVTTDSFAFDALVFGLTSIHFANGVIGAIPTSFVNVIVLETFDNDANPVTPFAAGSAADLIAAQITGPGAGFFIYFNSGLQTPRLVYSTDLNDNTADLKILARLTNLMGNSGALAGFTSANFQLATPVPATVPEGDGPAVSITALLALAAIGVHRRPRQASISR